MSEQKQGSRTDFIEEIDGKIAVSPEIKLIPCVRQLFRRDKGSEGDHEGRFKLMALKELAYVIHMNKHKGPYSDILPKYPRRVEAIKKNYGLPQDWKADSVVEAVEELYRERNRTFTMDFLDSALNGAYKLKNYFDNVDLDERDEKGKPIWSASQLLKNVSEVGKAVQGIKNLKAEVEKELGNAPIIKGGGEKGMDEDPD